MTAKIRMELDAQDFAALQERLRFAIRSAAISGDFLLNVGASMRAAVEEFLGPCEFTEQRDLAGRDTSAVRVDTKEAFKGALRYAYVIF